VGTVTRTPYRTLTHGSPTAHRRLTRGSSEGHPAIVGTSVGVQVGGVQAGAGSRPPGSLAVLGGRI
jgi:hypothetical protein